MLIYSGDCGLGSKALVTLSGPRLQPIHHADLHVSSPSRTHTPHLTHLSRSLHIRFNGWTLTDPRLILGPAFFSAWAYTILGYCIVQLGPAYSLLKPMLYLVIFIVADIVSLILQAIGGGGAAVKAMDGEDTHTSTQISEHWSYSHQRTGLMAVLAGILFQLGTMTIFSALAIDFIVRVISRKPWAFRQRAIAGSATVDSSVIDVSPDTVSVQGPSDRSITGDTEKVHAHTSRSDAQTLRRAQYLLVGIAFASVMIYVRGVYRSIELAQGWEGELITNEPYFTWLDGLPMVLCMASLAAAHPGFLLRRRIGWKKA